MSWRSRSISLFSRKKLANWFKEEQPPKLVKCPLVKKVKWRWDRVCKAGCDYNTEEMGEKMSDENSCHRSLQKTSGMLWPSRAAGPSIPSLGSIK